MAEEVKKEEAVESGKTFAEFLVKNGNKEEKAKDKDGKTKIGTTLTLKNYRDFLTSQELLRRSLRSRPQLKLRLLMELIAIMAMSSVPRLRNWLRLVRLTMLRLLSLRFQ